MNIPARGGRFEVDICQACEGRGYGRFSGIRCLDCDGSGFIGREPEDIPICEHCGQDKIFCECYGEKKGPWPE